MYNNDYINPHDFESSLVIQPIAYIIEYCGESMEKTKIFYLMFLIDFFSLVSQGRFISRDFYYFDGDEDEYGQYYDVDIYMYTWERILWGNITNGYITEDENGYVVLLQSHNTEFITEYEKEYIHPILEGFSHYTTDELASICSCFNVFDIRTYLTQESILYNDAVHPYLQPYMRDVEYAREAHQYHGDYK